MQESRFRGRRRGIVGGGVQVVAAEVLPELVLINVDPGIHGLGATPGVPWERGPCCWGPRFGGHRHHAPWQRHQPPHESAGFASCKRLGESSSSKPEISGGVPCRYPGG
jgi:hypothetical protein